MTREGSAFTYSVFKGHGIIMYWYLLQEWSPRIPMVKNEWNVIMNIFIQNRNQAGSEKKTERKVGGGKRTDLSLNQVTWKGQMRRWSFTHKQNHRCWADWSLIFTGTKHHLEGFIVHSRADQPFVWTEFQELHSVSYTVVNGTTYSIR